MEEQLIEVSGRLALLMEHLVGDALARRVDRADLVQETILRVLRSEATDAAADDGPAAFWAFVRTMARRVVIDAARKARLDPRRMSSLVPEARAGASSAPGVGGSPVLDWTRPGPGPATDAAVRETAHYWLAAYKRLGPEHRRVLGFRRFEGLSAAETALRMGRTETAVHSLFRRALAAWEAEAEGA